MSLESAPGHSRGWFPAAVAVAANVYLFGFALDGLLSVLDEVFHALAGGSVLGGLRTFVALSVGYATPLLLLAVIFIAQLPARVFAPLIVFEMWTAFYAPPFWWQTPSHRAGLLLSGFQVALAALAFVLVRTSTGAWRFSPYTLPDRTRPWLRVAARGIAAIVFVPAFAAVLIVADITGFIEARTHRYITFTASGIDLQETVLTKGDETAVLVGMVHIGEPKFYEELYKSFPPGALILAEGVSDREGKLEGSLSYRKLASALGLEQQPHFEELAAEEAPAAAEPLATPAPVKKSSKRGAKTAEPPAPPQPPAPGTRVEHPDADISDFSDSTITFLRKVSEVYGASSLADAIDRLGKLSKELKPSDADGVFADILTKRNARLLAAFDAKVGAEKAVVIPWGAMHLPGIEAGLVARGFKVQSRRELPLVRYSTVLQQLTTATPPANP